MFCSSSFNRCLLLVFACVTCIVAVVSSILSMVTEFRKAEIYTTEFGNFLPHHFVVSSLYDVPTRGNIGNDNTLVHSFINLLESFYRRQSIVAGKLPGQKAVMFSENAFASKIKQFCDTNINNSFCVEFYSRGSVQMMSLFFDNELQNFVYPKSICDDNGSIYECDFKESVPDNNIGLNIKDLKWAYSVQSIKELLYESNKPLLMSIPEPFADFYIPCTDSRVSESDECKNNALICPYNKEQCGILRYHARTSSGEFFLPNYPVGLHTGSPINFLVVGYTNSYVPSRGKGRLRSQHLSRGGFIIKPAYSKDYGFPISHLMGDISPRTAFSYCPNEQAPHFWGAPLVSCVSQGTDPSKCGSHSDGNDDSTTKDSESDILECTDSRYCNPDLNYTLTHLPVRTFETHIIEDQSLFPSTPMIEINGNQIRLFTFDKLPFYQLHLAFRKKTQYQSSSSCGYWYLPYDLVEKLHVVSNQKNYNVMAVLFDLLFEESKLGGKVHPKLNRFFEQSTTDVYERLQDYYQQ